MDERLTNFHYGQIHQFLLDKYLVPYRYKSGRRKECDRYKQAIKLLNNLDTDALMTKYNEYTTEKLSLCYSSNNGKVEFYKGDKFSQDDYYAGRCYQYISDRKYDYRGTSETKDMIRYAEIIHFDKLITPWIQEGLEYEIDECYGTWYYGNDRRDRDNLKIRLYVGNYNIFELPAYHLDKYKLDITPYGSPW